MGVVCKENIDVRRWWPSRSFQRSEQVLGAGWRMACWSVEGELRRLENVRYQLVRITGFLCDSLDIQSGLSVNASPNLAVLSPSANLAFQYPRPLFSIPTRLNKPAFTSQFVEVPAVESFSFGRFRFHCWERIVNWVHGPVHCILSISFGIFLKLRVANSKYFFLSSKSFLSTDFFLSFINTDYGKQNRWF